VQGFSKYTAQVRSLDTTIASGRRIAHQQIGKFDNFLLNLLLATADDRRVGRGLDVAGAGYEQQLRFWANEIPRVGTHGYWLHSDWRFTSTAVI
jgi:hypothetical protein